MAQGTNSIRMTFRGADPDLHEVPLSYMTDALSALQEAIFLLAMQQEGVSVRRRERPSHKLEDKYGIYCAPLRPGSVVVEARVGSLADDLFLTEDHHAVVKNYFQALEAVANEDLTALSQVIPDETRRAKMIQTFRRAAPKAGTPWSVDIAPDDHGVVRLTQADQQKVKALLEPREMQASRKTITGRLSKIDFDAKKLSLLYPVTGRELECHYEESVEALLLDHPRELIQVTGYVVLDQDGAPVRINSVDAIEELDLTPFEASRMSTPRLSLHFSKPFRLDVRLDETEQLLSVEDPELEILAFAPTRDELYTELVEQIEMMWFEYAEAADDELTEGAQELKRALRARMQREDADA